MGFDLPNPDEKPGKMNNRKKSFDAACRAMLFDICERHGLHLDQEPEYGGRKYLEKQDFILMKQKEKIEAREAELNAITVRIEDTETFVNEITETAYEKAVEAVTKTVQGNDKTDHRTAGRHLPFAGERGRNPGAYPRIHPGGAC